MSFESSTIYDADCSISSIEPSHSSPPVQRLEERPTLNDPPPAEVRTYEIKHGVHCILSDSWQSYQWCLEQDGRVSVSVMHGQHVGMSDRIERQDPRAVAEAIIAQREQGLTR